MIQEWDNKLFNLCHICFSSFKTNPLSNASCIFSIPFAQAGVKSTVPTATPSPLRTASPSSSVLSPGQRIAYAQICQSAYTYKVSSACFCWNDPKLKQANKNLKEWANNPTFWQHWVRNYLHMMLAALRAQ